MIKSINFKDYRCFQDAEITFKDISIIVGKNNAGKSTLIEALRIISLATMKFKKAKYVLAPKELNLPNYSKGFFVNLEHMNINLSTVIYQYQENTIARLTAEFNEGLIIRIYLTTDFVFAVIQSKDFEVTSNVKAKKLPDIHLNIMPQLSLLREEEKILTLDTVNKQLHTRLSSLHFRNELSIYTSYFDEFKSFAERTWDGLRILDVNRDEFEGKIELMVFDAEYAAEIGLMGSGLQMWLQVIWFISRCEKSSTIVLDEPDIYMHPDLQIKILQIIKNLFNQTIIATHSVEIISSVEASQIITVNKKNKRMQYLSNNRNVQKVIDSLGSPHNLSLVRLAEGKKCIFVEGKDIKLLSKFYEKLYPQNSLYLESLPSIQLGGWTNFKQTLGASKLFYKETSGEIKTFCILDRDYHSEEEINKLYTDAKRNNLSLHIWTKKELENYIVTPSSIFRLTKLPQSEYSQFKTRLYNDIIELKQQTIDGFLDQLGATERGTASSTNRKKATRIVDDKWNSLENIFSLVNGKELIKFICRWLKNEYGKSCTKAQLLNALTVEEIDCEIKTLLKALTES